MQEMIAQPQNQSLRDQLYRQVKSQQLFIASYGIPVDTPKQANDLVKIPLYTAEAPDGSKALLAYLDTDTLKAQCKEAFIVRLSGAQALDLVLMQDHLAALVLKASFGWVGISKTDVRRLVKGYAV